jgi:hypothetical protein
MNKLLLYQVFFLLILNLASPAAAQSDQKVKWQFSAVKKSNKLYEVRLTATIEKGWHLYSQQQSPDAIALPTSIVFSKNPIVDMKGKPKEEGKLFDEIEAATRTRSRYYVNKVEFIQQVELKKNIKTSLNGEVEFMVCDDRQCLPPGNVKFSVKIQ